MFGSVLTGQSGSQQNDLDLHETPDIRIIYTLTLFFQGKIAEIKTLKSSFMNGEQKMEMSKDNILIGFARELSDICSEIKCKSV